MTNVQSSEATPQTVVQGSATTPIMGSGFDPNRTHDISWEVSDGTLPDIPTTEEIPIQEEPPLQEPEEIKKDISLEEESVEDEDEEEKVEKKKKHKPRNTAEKRIAELNRQVKQAKYEKAQAEAFAYNATKEKDVLQKELLKKREENLTTNRDYLKVQLEEAHEDGDSKRVAELTDVLGQYNAELRLVNQRKETITVAPPQVVQPLQENYQIPENHPHKGVGEEWVKTNTWADPESVNFDQDMYEESDNYSLSLMKQYKFEGRANEIGSPEFFEEITDHVKDTFGLSKRDLAPKTQIKEKLQMTAPSSTVSPVNRPAVNAETTRTKQEIELTPDQRAIAHSMRGFLRDKNGQRISDVKQLEEAYKRNLRG